MNAEKNLSIILFKLLDLGLTCLAFIVSCVIWGGRPAFGSIDGYPYYLNVLFLIIVVWHIVFSILGLHSHYKKRVSGKIVFDIIRAVLICATVFFSLVFVFKIGKLSRVLIAVFLLVDTVLLIGARWVIFAVCSLKRSSPYYACHIVVVGSGETARKFIESIPHDSDIKIMACLGLTREEIGKIVGKNVKVTGTTGDLKDTMVRHAINEVVLAVEPERIPAMWYMIALANAFGVTVRVLPGWYVEKLYRHRSLSNTDDSTENVDRFFAESAFVLSGNISRNNQLILKNIFDCIAASALLIITMPLFIVVPVLIKLSSKGPVFYRQERCGLHGRRFTCYKFRTMVENADRIQEKLSCMDETDGPVFKVKDDPRIIPYVGKFLRRTGIDELPQLLNVIIGQMSLVGPRPALPKEVEQYDLWHRRRLSMKPGITCIWQVMPGRNKVSFEKWMEMDLEYIDNWSLWLDCKLIIKTVPAILFGYGQ